MPGAGRPSRAGRESRGSDYESRLGERLAERPGSDVGSSVPPALSWHRRKSGERSSALPVRRESVPPPVPREMPIQMSPMRATPTTFRSCEEISRPSGRGAGSEPKVLSVTRQKSCGQRALTFGTVLDHSGRRGDGPSLPKEKQSKGLLAKNLADNMPRKQQA